MKTYALILCGTLALLAGSCIPSLFPLYTADDIVYDDAIEGTWDGGDYGIWTIKKLELHPNRSFWDPDWTEPDEESDPENIHYKLTVKQLLELQGTRACTSEAEFILHLLMLEEKMYLNFYPYDFELHHGFLSWHMIEANAFARIQVYDDKLEIRFFNPGFLTRLIEENKIRISHISRGGKILLTAPTGELQKFVIKYGRDAEALFEPDVFRRI